jgi:hypothetical protein
MARRKRQQPGDWLFPQVAAARDAPRQSSVLDVVDKVLNKGAVIKGDLVLGVANVDLIYAELSALLAAIDRITKHEDPRKARRSTKPRSRTQPRRVGRARRSTKRK